MPADFTVVSVQSKDQWSNDFGTYQSYDLVVTGPGAPNTPVSLNRKLKDGAVPQDKIPQQGQTLYLEIQGTKAKEVQRDEGPSPSNANGASSRTDATGRSIEAQVAAKCAAEILSNADLASAAQSQVAERVHFLTATFYEAIQATQTRALPQPPEPVSGGSTTATDPTTTVPVADDSSIPF